jgi:hypothetical protein
MFFPTPDEMKLTPEHQDVLRNLVIDASSPGSLLHDFEAMLDTIRQDRLELTASHQLPMRVLADLNERLAHPLQLGLKRPRQKSYPPLYGLYLLARASGLTEVDETGRKPALLLDEAVYQGWAALNPVERYGGLLETWLLRGKPEILGERGRPPWPLPENFREAASFYTRIPGDGLAVAGNREVEEWLMYSPGWHNLGLLHLFGLIRVQDRRPEPGQGWHIERIRRTPVGDALLAALYSGFFGSADRILLHDEETLLPFGPLQAVLRPYWPCWKNTLPAPAPWTFREGTHVFKVSLGRIWRRIAIDAHESLDSLASIILDSVDFDPEHLYRFFYRNRYGLYENINHPFLEEEPLTSEVEVGDVPLRIGQTMTYLFDFGDHWEFEVTLEDVQSDQPVKRPRILDRHGPSPEQYPGW